MAAKSIHKMLKDGIDTWAPKLPVKKAVVYFSSRNIPEEVDALHLRSIIIGDTLVRMLEYSKVDVIRRNPFGDMYGMLIDFLFERLTNQEVDDHLATGEIPVGRSLDYLFERVPNGEVGDHTIGELEVFYEEWKKNFYESFEFRNISYQSQVLYQGADERYLIAWAQICEIDRKSYEKVYQRLGVHVEEKSKSSCDYNIPEILYLLRKVHGLIQISGEKQVIFVRNKSPIPFDFRERIQIPLTLVKEDGSYDYALTDLSDLWYEVNEEKADWIIYVANRGKEYYIDMCITAARRAGWLPTDEDEYPRTTFVGYGLVDGDNIKRFRTCSTQVVDLLDEAKTRCKAALVEHGKADVWTAEELENTAEALGCGAVKYAYLKTDRLTNCTFNFDQMLNDKGNTAIYILYIYARICSIIRKSGKDIEELKKAGELILETDEEHELGLHLLRFIEVVAEVCLVLKPHILCEYLYDLSEKFNSLCSSVCKQKVVGSAEDTGIVGSAEETRNLSEKFTSFHQVEKAQQVSEKKTPVSSVSQEEGQQMLEVRYECRLCRYRPLNSRKELEKHLSNDCLVLMNRKLFGSKKKNRKILRSVQTTTAGASSSSSASALSEVDDCTRHPTTSPVLKNQKLLGGVQTTTAGASSSSSASALSEVDDCTGHPTTSPVMRICSVLKNGRLLGGVQTTTAGASSSSTASALSEVDDCTGHPTTPPAMRICSYAEETHNLLLCEATAVVMKKCFHLLGITPIYNI